MPHSSHVAMYFACQVLGLKDHITSLRDDLIYYSHQENLTQYLNAKDRLGAETTHL